jgi:uncharacterized lipoprotein YddW (UPF0748 family)
MLTLLSHRLRRRASAIVGALVLTLVLLITGLPVSPLSSPVSGPEVAQAQEQPPMEQMRAFWVPAHAAGFHNHAQVDELVNNVVRANANTIIVQMRRHGDSYYNNSIEPRAIRRGLAPAESFDPLAYLIARAHQDGIKVHAWLVASVACRSTDPLWGHPEHLCTDHGPYASGAQRWTTATYNGTQVGDMDFGHPGAVVHFEQVVQNLIWNYPEVDGIHLDFIRYGDMSYGYNDVSLYRFRQYYNLPENYRPAPDDFYWSQWRRDRVTETVRRVYVRTKAIDPQIEVSMAAITWGGLGTYSPTDWPNSAAYARVFQDWPAWLEEGIIDFAVPMMYFEEGKAQTRGWYNNWLEFGRVNQGRRAIVVGTGAWLNNDMQGISQIHRAITPDEAGRTFSGVALYAYNQPLAGSGFERRRQFMDQLRESVFSYPAVSPNWPWVYYPSHGHLQGIAAVNGKVMSDSHVSIVRDGQWLFDVPTGYDGWYGVVDLEPGHYNIVIQDPETGAEVWHEVMVNAGAVTNGP